MEEVKNFIFIIRFALRGVFLIKNKKRLAFLFEMV